MRPDFAETSPKPWRGWPLRAFKSPATESVSSTKASAFTFDHGSLSSRGCHEPRRREGRSNAASPRRLFCADAEEGATDVERSIGCKHRTDKRQIRFRAQNGMPRQHARTRDRPVRREISLQTFRNGCQRRRNRLASCEEAMDPPEASSRNDRRRSANLHPTASRSDEVDLAHRRHEPRSVRRAEAERERRGEAMLYARDLLAWGRRR